MPSPFPGMDPFLENHWGDVHTSLMTYARNQLKKRLIDDLVARIEEFVHLEIEGSDERPRFSPDVRIVEQPSGFQPDVSTEESVIAAQPWVIPLNVEWTERWIQILDRAGDRVVTTIEFLSPGNKSSPKAREQFQAKQQRLLDAGVNLVEIDLVREGGWALTAPRHLVPDNCSYPYRIIVIRGTHPSRAECYESPLRAGLPAIRVPLRPGDKDVVLDLQPLVDAAWEDGTYGPRLYERRESPRFKADDEIWMQAQIAASRPVGQA